MKATNDPEAFVLAKLIASSVDLNAGFVGLDVE
jgi:hypothetical protein